MNGSIGCVSEQNKGTAFLFSCLFGECFKEQHTRPRSCSENAKKQCIAPTIPQGTRVLLVEDQLVNMKVLTRMLTNIGVEVAQAVNGREAVDKCKQMKFSMVFMDLMMPVLDGISATRIIRKYESENNQQQGIPIIILTANAVRDLLNDCIDAGANECITKPVSLQTLTTTVYKYIKVH